MERIILHVDMDCFFAQVEERENPRFKGKSVVVGADPKGGKGRGVVSTANYEARKYGIHSALPISQAFKLCPEAVFLPPNMQLYEQVSSSIFGIVGSYSALCEVVSLDEAYLDISFLSEKKDSYGEAEKLAETMKNEIKQKESLTCTVGIGPNKLIAKIAAQKAKPDGLLSIKPVQVRRLLNPLDVTELPGVGSATAKKLRSRGINTIRQLAAAPKNLLEKTLGKLGLDVYEMARGRDSREVTAEREIKSIGSECTFERDTRDPERILKTFADVIEQVHGRLAQNGFCFRTVTVVCRFSDFTTCTKSVTLKRPTQSFRVLEKTAKTTLLKFLVGNNSPIRLVGLRLSKFSRI